MAAFAFNSATMVLGMHRSGTSAVTGVMRLCGLAAPKTLVPPSEANTRGFWESQPIKALNDEIFGTLGLTWRSLDEIGDLDARRFGHSRRRAESLLGKEFDPGSDILIKDPRLCRLLPLWQPVLSNAAARVGYTLVIRNPIEVAQSLTRRNDLNLHHGLLLWTRYCLDAEFHTRGKRRAFVSFDRLLGDWRESLAGIRRNLDLAADPDRAACDSIDAFLESDLRHHHEAGDDTLADKPAMISETYRILQGWSEGARETSADYEWLDSARTQLDQMSAAVADIFETARLDRKRWAGARAQVEQNSSQIAQLHRSLDRIEEIGEAVNRQSGSIESLAGSSERALGELRTDIASRLSESDGRLTAAVADVSGLAAALRNAQAGGFESLARSAADLLNAISGVGDSVARVGASVSELGTSISEIEVRDGQMATAITALTMDHGAILTALQAKVESILETGEEQATLLCGLTTSLHDRKTLEETLAQAVRTGADTAAKLDRLVAEAADTAESFAHERTEFLAAQKRLADGAAEKEAKARSQIEALDAELKRTKRKYRASQWHFERERRAHRTTQSQLAAAEAVVAHYRSSLLLRGYSAVAQSLEKVTAAARRKTGATRRRRKDQMQLIASSGLFDGDWYLTTYPDVAAAAVDPLGHFVDLGWREGRDPGSGFNTSSYLKANADVARAGINPLVHYIEFGRSEGRELKAPPRSTEPPAPPIHNFAEPAPVFRGSVAADRPVRWRRSYRLELDDPRLVEVAGLAIAYADPDRRRGIEAAFARLAHLSGLDGGADSPRQAVADTSATLIDAWHVNKMQLRTRWRDGGEPFVVRAFQHDPLGQGRVSLVAEGLVTSELDFVEVSLSDPYFPLLFIFADPDGDLRGGRLMPFPSLCRGGLHYAELLAASPGDPDPIELGLAEAARIEEARENADRPIQTILVDAAGGDGTFPLSEPTFRNWLAQVARVEIRPADMPWSKAPASNGGSLWLAADMVPTIHALGEAAGNGAALKQPMVLPLLIAGTEPSQPANLVELPFAPAVVTTATADYPAPWPRFIPAERSRPLATGAAAAIRIAASRDLSDSELLVPVAGADLPVPAAPVDITWMFVAADWQPAELVQSIRALSLQSGASGHVVAFVGEPDATARSVADDLFGRRVRRLPDLAAAADDVDTTLIGYIGAGVVLHDARSAAVLAHLLSDSAIASAGCVLVKAEPHGKGWDIAVADGGEIAVEIAPGQTVAGQYNPALPWRSCFPVARPPRDLWIARTSSAKSWIRTGAPEPLSKGIHLCTSLVTASYLGGREEHAREMPVPSATAGRATRTRMLFG